METKYYVDNYTIYQNESRLIKTVYSKLCTGKVANLLTSISALIGIAGFIVLPLVMWNGRI